MSLPAMETVEVDCPLCGGNAGRTVFTTRDYALRVSDTEFGVKACKSCGAGYLSPRPREQDLTRFYPDEFYWMHEGAEEKLSRDELLEVRRPQLEAKAACLDHLQPGRLLDIGAQKGDFLFWMHELGWQVEGVEFSETAPKAFDVPIHYGDFLDFQLTEESYDCVTMWAVLEHVYEPEQYVEKISRVLKPGATFAGLVTNFESVQSRYLRQDDYPRHLTMFTRKSLEQVLARHGFEIQRTWTDRRIFGGQLHGALTYFAKRLFGYSADDIFYEWKNADDALGFCCEWRGHSSWTMKQISRLDKLILTIPGLLLEKIGRGFNLGWVAVYKGRA